jgi:hypothetical protein
MNKKIYTLSRIFFRKFRDRRMIFSINKKGEVLVFDDKWMEELK